MRELTPERVLLALQEPPPVLDQPLSAPMPGGGTLEVRERTESQEGGAAGAPDTHTLMLVYDAPALGAVEMRFVLGPSALMLELSVRAGDSFEEARESASELREALTEALQQRRSR